jgi:predicted Zn-dependent protease
MGFSERLLKGLGKHSLARWKFFIPLIFISFSSPWTHGFSLRTKEGSIVYDSETNEFLQGLIQPALQHLPTVPNVSFHLIVHPMINAFTAGEPSIFIHTGLIEKSRNPGDLIAVLLHELGHIAGHHVIQKIAEIKRTQYHNLIPAILGIMAAATTGKGELAPMGMALGDLNSTMSLLGHSRDHEYFADRFAINMLSKLHWPSSCFFDFMEMISKQDRLSKDYSPYWQTHPFPRDRLRVARGQNVGGKIPETFQDQLQKVKAKLIAFVYPVSQASAALERSDISDPIKNYGRSIIAYRCGRYDQALKHLETFESYTGPSPFIHELKAQIFFESRKFKEALKAIDAALQKRPQDETLGGYKAQILIENSQTKKAIPILERLLLSSTLEGSHPDLWYWLAIAYGREQKMGRMKVCLAEHACFLGDAGKAKKLLDAALKILPPNDTYYRRAKDLQEIIEAL